MSADDRLGMDDELRKELTDYYKWVVSLAVFILSTSLALASYLGSPPHKTLLATGWILLAFCIVVNWLLVKSLISGRTVAATPIDEWTIRHVLFAEGWLKRLRLFGAAQQLAFVVGSALVATAFVLWLLGT